jgi:MFS transporter, OFA family, oxalate/formate antiporter
VPSRWRNGRLFYGWVIVATALTMNLAASPLNAAVFSFFVTPMSEDLGWSKSDLSWGYTMRLIVAGISAPIVGALLDRIGSRVLGTLAGLIAGFCVLGLAGMHSLVVFYVLFAISGVAGFGAPGGQLLTTVPIAKWFHTNRGRALAIATVGMPLGTAIFLPVVEVLIDKLGWREAWLIAGIMVIGVIAVPCAIFMRKDPESMGLHPDGFDHPPVFGGIESAANTATSEEWTARQAIRSPTMWMIVAAMMLMGAVLPGTVLYRTSYWQDVGLPTGVIALATALDPFMVSVSALFWGFLSERIHARYIGFFGGMTVGCAMLLMIFAQNNVIYLLAFNMTWGTGMGANITVQNIIWPNYFGRRNVGTIRGIVFPISVIASAASAPLFATLLDTVPEQRYVWIVTLAGFWAAALLILAAKRPRLPTAVTLEATSLEAAGA